MSSKIPKHIYLLKSNIVFIVSLAVWVILFATLYTPTFGRIPIGPDYVLNPDSVQSWYKHSSFCIPILCSILIGVVSISRVIMWFTTRTTRLSELEYLLWQVCEFIVSSLFFTLFLSLFFHHLYFALLPHVLLITLLVLAPIYSIHWLFSEKKEKEQRLSDASQTISELRSGLIRTSSESGVMKFVDEKGNVKLLVSASLVYLIEAAGNYVTILYENNGHVTRFALRNTLKAVEELCEAHDIVRCHRSWFVNVSKIRLLRHDPDGIYAEIDGEGIADVPVSKNYASAVIQKLSAN